MKKILVCIIFAIVLIVAFPTSAEEVSEDYKIDINTGSNSISVEESFNIIGETSEYYDEIVLWIPDNAEEIAVLFNNNEASLKESASNEHTYNISGLTIQKNSSMDVSLSYTLSKDEEEFEKSLIRDTASLSITFNGEDNRIFYGESLIAGNKLEIKLYTPAETPLSWTVILLIFLLIIFLIVLSLYSFKRQKTTKLKSIGNESEELLSTNKTLLMSLLKDIEKQHRAKKISDETYNKLKDQYKQQAVDTMKKLEDYKSK